MFSRISQLIATLAILTVGLQPATATAAPDNQTDCATAQITQRVPEPNTWWTINAGTYRALNVWSNQPDSKQVERKLFLYPNDYIEVLGGGTLASWPAHCGSQAIDGYNRIRLDEVTTDQLGSIEWLCCDQSVQAKWDVYLGIGQQTTEVAAQEGCPRSTEVIADNRRDVELRGPAIAHPWWNDRETGWGQNQTKVVIRPGQQTTFVQMLGRAYVYENTDACNSRLDSEIQNGNFDRKELSDYRAKNLIR